MTTRRRPWAGAAFVVCGIGAAFFGITLLRVLIPVVRAYSSRGLGPDETPGDVLIVLGLYAFPFFGMLALSLLFARLGGSRSAADSFKQTDRSQVTSLFEFDECIIISGLAVSIGLSGALDFATALNSFAIDHTVDGRVLEFWTTVRGVTTVFVLPTILGVWGFWLGITRGNAIAVALAVLGPIACAIAISAVTNVGIQAVAG